MNNFAAKNPVVQEGEMKFEIPRGGTLEGGEQKFSDLPRGGPDPVRHYEMRRLLGLADQTKSACR